jgi:hypothetical protein
MSVDVIQSTPDLLPRNCDVRLGRLFSYWRSIAPPEADIPGRQHFDPIQVPDILPLIWLLDIQHNPLRFKYRLVGAEREWALGLNPVGFWLDEIHPDFMAHPYYCDYVDLATGGHPSFRHGFPEFQTRRRSGLQQRLLLPLARDGVCVDMLLGATVYRDLQNNG